MDILEVVGIEIPCRNCGGRYEVSLKKIALSEQMLHDGCPVRQRLIALLFSFPALWTGN